MQQRARRLFLFLLVLVLILWLLSFAFRNPDTTQTRLFLTYWPQYGLGALLLLACLIVLDNWGSP